MPLTEQQYIASTNRGGNLLVSAAAGSGKTKVLVERLMGYLEDPNAHLDDFLIITYTKAAAAELRGKIAARLTEAIAEDPDNKHLQRQMQRLFLAKISTVHGFCSDVVREYAQQLGIGGDFRVADENECTEIRERVLKDLLDEAYIHVHEDEDFRAFVDNQGQGRDDRALAEVLLKVYNSAMCHPDPEHWLDKCLADSRMEDLTDASQTVWGRYVMDEFFSYLDLCIGIMERNAAMAEAEVPGSKAVQNLNVTLVDLRSLRSCQTWDAIVNHRPIDYGRLAFPKSADPVIKARIQTSRDACKDGLKKRMLWFTDDSEVILGTLAQAAPASRGLIAMVRRFRDAFDKAKRARRCVDFSDLEHLTLKLLWRRDTEGNRVPTAAAAELGSRFREIMVDEYQDSNEVQDSIFRAISGDRGNCFMVGDVKQSIYQFRLADPSIFLKKYGEYAPVEQAEEGKGRKVLLSANFRSGPEVIEAVNHVFSACMCPRVGGLVYGDDESLKLGRPHAELQDPAVELHCIDVQHDAYGEESAYVADLIRRMLEEGTTVRGRDGLRPVRPEDIVILLRSPNTVGEHFQRAVEARGIPCTTGGSRDLLEAQEIQVLRSILQTISNPRQDIPLLATLASPVFGFTADELAAFRGMQKTGSVYDALLLDENPRSKAFLETLEVLRREARMYSIAHLIQKIFQLTRMDSIYGARADGEVRWTNLQAFYRAAAKFENGSHRDLEQFLDYLVLQEEKGLTEDTAGLAGAVQIQSIHKSKGLEYPVVILAGLARGFNTESQRAQVMCHKELGLGLSVADSEKRARYGTIAKRAIAARMAADSLSEEMRVLYVAMTRPQDRLIMTCAGKKMEQTLTEFALQMEDGRSERLVREASSMGDWVLMAALSRRECRGLLADEELRCQCNVDSAYPWKVTLGMAPETTVRAAAEEESPVGLPDGAVEKLKTALDFSYAHSAATQAPSKQTATQRKGRSKDQEAAEHAPEPRIYNRTWRRPGFMEKGGKDYGNAMHAAMQYIHYECCGSVDGVEKELDRLEQARFLTGEQRKSLRPREIARFFATPLGQKLVAGAEHIREFKFSILDNGANYGAGLEGEQVLLQGVVDCALIEEDGITVIDFKTDRVNENTVKDALERYRLQVETYADALERIYGKPVKASYLYFFALGDFCKV